MSARRRVHGAVVVLAVLLGVLGGAAGAQEVQPGPDAPAPEGDGLAPVAGSDSDAPPGEPVEVPLEELPPVEGPLASDLGVCVTTATGCVDPATLAALLANFEAAAVDEARALAELGTGLDRLNELEGQLRDLNARVAEVNLRLLAARSAARYAVIRVEVAEQNLADVQLALAAEEDQLRQQAVVAYMGGGQTQAGLDQVFALLQAESALELVSVRLYAQAVLDDQQRTIDRVVALRFAVEGLGAELAAAEDEAAAVVAEIAAIEATLEQLWAAQRELVARAEAEVEQLGRIVGEIRERKDEYAAELFTSTAAASGSIAGVLRDRQVGQALPASTVGILQNPVPGARIVSNFGPRLHPILGYVRIHAGVDIDGPLGAPVRAAADGVVVLAEEQGGYGLVTVIDHGNGIGTVYAHLSGFVARPGDVVTTGQVIGLLGSTGLSTGPHVHFEVRVFGYPVDPIPFLDLGYAPAGPPVETDHHDLRGEEVGDEVGEET